MGDNSRAVENYTSAFLAMFCMTIFAVSMCLWAMVNFQMALAACAAVYYVISRIPARRD
ncbi:MAG: hypothetical protein ABJ327_12165 [Litoreibacter sp.]